MLSEMTSMEVSEWYAYSNLKARRADEASENAKSAEAAKKRAKENNF
jgi:hypothetical protein